MGVGNEELEIQGPEEMCEGHTLYKWQQRVGDETLVFLGDCLGVCSDSHKSFCQWGQRLGTPGVNWVDLL